MSNCGCSAFDGEDFDESFDNVVTDGLDWTSEDEIQRDGMEFGDDRNPMLNFGGNGYTGFVDDVETDEFDNFLTKKMRARNKLKKELKAGGLDKKEAKAQALAQIPRDKLKDIVARLKAGKNPDTAGLSPDEAEAVNSSSTDDVSTAMTNQGDDNLGTSEAPAQAGFFANNKMAVVGGIALVVIVGGYFAFGKKLGIRK